MTNKYNINNYTKISFTDTLFGEYGMFDYKLVIYWLPIVIYLIIMTIYIIYYNEEYESIMSIIAVITIYIVYFIIDLIYQFLLCKKKNIYKFIYNSLINAISPSIFIGFGYILASILRKRSVYSVGSDYMDNPSIYKNIYITRLYNLHINNILVSIFFYIFSIFYVNPPNKVNCISNKLC